MNLMVWLIDRKDDEWIRCEKLGAVSGKQVCNHLAIYTVAVRDVNKETEQRLCRVHAIDSVHTVMTVLMPAVKEVDDERI